MGENELRIELATSIRMLEFLGLIDFSGHVSVRDPNGNGIFINSWGGSRCSLGPQDIARADMDGESLDPGITVPSEIHIHTSIYRMRPDVQSVAHLHPPVTTALSVAGKTYVPVMHHGAIFASGVPVHDNCGHVNSKVKGDVLAELLADQRALIMRGHGAVVVAESIKGVFFGSVYLEDNAKKLAEAWKMGEPIPLREDEVAAAAGVWRQNQFNKVWQYYQEKSGIHFQ
jgi:ribulose-5-phosphate 4-epimerase/fuculose-1-phosphate aldolase